MGILETVKNLFGFGSSTVLPEEGESIPKPHQRQQTGPPPAAQRRDQVIRFVIDKLRIYQNEPANAPVGLQVLVLCGNPEEEEVYRVAVWASQPGRFQNELNRQLADHYVNLPKDWQFECAFFREQLPACTFREGNLGLVVLDAHRSAGPARRARVTVLVGQAEQPAYLLDPEQKTIFYMGRGRTSQTSSGRVRTNDLVILHEDDPAFDPQIGVGNRAVSRAHATIQFDPAKRSYRLLVDPGGLPASGNKTKLIHPNDTIERADIAGMTYPLQSGDQIELGGEVTLLFELID
ncbi:FHA domain-containing protein [Larkinella bovis]|uniref:FHA domain-containing protein n=1 Tax=Larkinella bovis TaxID=683041 RepID=A0ABW0IJ26_9BACT